MQLHSTVLYITPLAATRSVTSLRVELNPMVVCRCRARPNVFPHILTPRQLGHPFETQLVVELFLGVGGGCTR